MPDTTVLRAARTSSVNNLKTISEVGNNSGMGVVRRSACLVFGPVAVGSFASLFNCTPVGRASGSVMAPTWGYLF